MILIDLDLDRRHGNGLIPRITHVKYESSITSHSKVIANVKVYLLKYDLDIFTLTLIGGLDLGTTEKSYHKKYTCEI